MKLRYDVPGDDLSLAGKASAEVKRALGRLGVDPGAIKRAAVSMYEAEINMVIHGGGGVATAELSPERVVVVMEDSGPGIPDLDLAMQEGYSTAPEWIREMGFGAGMGLPNMKRNADELRIESEVGRGTKVTIVVAFGAAGGAEA
ncbi:MAG: ATP-binding protein [Spirochaetes bacterium]|nr:ATP-binding protein [Spirochaetota bacterium]MBU1079373.1 ATP-binding protein [Spirochaetota bacterium]